MLRFEFVITTIHRAGRGLWRAPGFATAVVATLALGIGANTAVLSLVRHVLLRPLPFPDSNALVTVGTSSKDGVLWEAADYNISAWQGSSRTLSAISWVRAGIPGHTGGQRAERVRGVRAASNLLEVLRVRPALGRWFAAEEERTFEPVAVISYAVWQRSFRGDTGVVGSASIRVGDRSLTVIGVLPPGAVYPVHADFWYPHPDNLAAEVVARIKPETAITDVRAELRALAPGIEANRRAGLSIDFVVVPLHERLFGVNRPVLQLLLGAVVLLLVLACTNVANLSLARAWDRQREFAVYMALGASQRLVTSQLVAESVILSVVGGAVGVATASFVTNLLVRLSPAELTGLRDAKLWMAGVGFGISAAMVSGVATSVASVISSGRVDLRSAMGQPGTAGLGRGWSRLRSSLIVVQLAAALVLMIGSGLMIRSMVQLTRIDAGFDTRKLAIARLLLGDRYRTSASRWAFVSELVSRLKSVPGVRSVSVGPPPLVGKRGRAFTEGFSAIYSVRDSTAPGAPRHTIWVKYVDPAYLETFRIRVLAGRGITAADDAGAPAIALVNEAAQRVLFADGGALGQALNRIIPELTHDRPVTVVGLLPNVRQRDITIPAYPEIWLPLAQQHELDPEVYIAARTDGDPRALVRSVRQILATLDGELEPRRLSTMDAVIQETLATERFVLAALSILSVLGLLLASVGLYAVVAYLTATRTREFGVRIALGAPPTRVLWMVMSEALQLAVVGATIGLLVAYAVTGVLSKFLYEVGRHDAQAFLMSAGALVLAAAFAAYVPAIRATRTDPLRALRAE